MRCNIEIYRHSIGRRRSFFSRRATNPEIPVAACSFISRMKYWSCCKRKTSDFNTFLSQEGCAKGTHMWRKKDTVRVRARA